MLLLGKEAMAAQDFGNAARKNGWASAVEFIYGARLASLLAGVEDFEQAGLESPCALTMDQKGNNDLCLTFFVNV